MFGAQTGWIELCYAADPHCKHLHRSAWEWYSADSIHRIAKRIASLIDRYSNVYVSAVLYSERRRSADVALPSRVVFVDDAPDAPSLPATFVVRTSQNSRHSYYILDHPADAATRRDLQRRAAAALGADKSGADVEQLVRVPSSFNTKYGGRFPVTLEHVAGPTYSMDRLRASWPAVAHPAASSAASIDWQTAAQHTANVDILLRRVKPHTFTHKQIHGGGVDRSKTRFQLACELRRRYGFPDDEIAAILYVHNWGHLDQKGQDWLCADIARCIALANGRYPDVTTSVTRYNPAPAPAPPDPAMAAATSRARKDRPRTIDADGLLAWYEATVTAGRLVMMARHEVMAQLGISSGTLGRLERLLRERGAILRHTSADRRTSWVELCGAADDDHTENRISAGDDDHTVQAIAEHQIASPHTGARVVKHTAPVDPAPVRAPALVELVREAIDAYGSNLRRVKRYIAANDPRPWKEAAIEWHYRAELERRRWARHRERIAGMTDRELRGAIRSAESHIDQAGRLNKRSHAFWLHYWRDLCEEQRRRRLAASAPRETARHLANRSAEGDRRGDRRRDPPARHLAGRLPEGSTKGVCFSPPLFDDLPPLAPSAAAAGRGRRP